MKNLMNKQRIMTGMLAVAMTVSSSVLAYAEPSVAGAMPEIQNVQQIAPGEDAQSAAPGGEGNPATTTAPGGEGNQANTTAPGGEGNQANTTAPGGGEGQTSTTVTAGGEGQGSSTVTAGSGENQASTTAPSGDAAQTSTTVTAGGGSQGSSTVTAGGGSQSGAQTAPNTQTSTTVQAGSDTRSSVVVQAGGGLAGPGVAGPGMQPGLPAVSVSDGNTSFAGTIQNPIVTVTEKYSYDQMCRDINSMKSRYGNLMQTNVIGTTLDGRSLYEIILGNPNAEKHILIHAGIHAREYMTPLLVMKQVEHGLAFYSSGSYEGQPLSNILNQVAIHYVPMVNPDGISLSQFGIGAIRSEQLRQTINQSYAYDIAAGRTSAAFDRYLNYWKANGRGVDLNQNFPANWDAVKSCDHPSYATYKGTGPLSEPESQAIANLGTSRNWALTISYHSMGNIIYWDYQGNQVSAQSHELASLVSAKTGYRLAGSSGHGGFKDWMQIKEGPSPSLTLEVGSVACPLPVTEFSDVWNRNHEVWAAVAKYAMEH